MADADGGSIVFDRAVEYYDETRSLDAEAASAVTDLLLTELRGRGAVLEIGAGTGRICLPLALAGIPIAALDLSGPMLGRLLSKPGAESVVTIVGDATRLPFPDAAFGGAIASHVFHLIPNWQDAADELVRVVRGGGVVLAARGEPSAVVRGIRRQFFDAAGGDGEAPGLRQLDGLDAYWGARGIRARSLDPVVTRPRVSPGRFIQQLEEGLFSACWRLPEGVRRRAAEATRLWAQERFGNLDSEIEIEQTVSWGAYDLPA